MSTKSPNKEVFSTLDFKEENKERKRSENRPRRSLDPTKSLGENWKIEEMENPVAPETGVHSGTNHSLAQTTTNQMD